jgi:cytochrome c
MWQGEFPNPLFNLINLKGEPSMKKMTAIALMSATLLAGVSVTASANEALAKKNGCLACHAVDHKVVGPAYKDVAAKYKGQDVEDKLVEKVKKGGAGAWGAVPMPANAKVSDADLHTLVKWILSL